MVRQRVRRTITAAVAFVAFTTGGLAACSADEATRAASPAPEERSRTTGPARPKPDGAADTPTSPPPMHVVDETPLGNDEDPLVVVVGDSLTVTVADELRGALGSRRTMFAAWYGEGWSGGPFSMVSGTVSLVADVGETFVDLEPAAIVLALGTNDAWQLDAGEVALAAVDRYHALFENTCVIAVTVPEDVPEQSTYDGGRRRDQRAPPPGSGRRGPLGGARRRVARTRGC